MSPFFFRFSKLDRKGQLDSGVYQGTGAWAGQAAMLLHLEILRTTKCRMATA